MIGSENATLSRRGERGRWEISLNPIKPETLEIWYVGL